MSAKKIIIYHLKMQTLIIFGIVFIYLLIFILQKYFGEIWDIDYEFAFILLCIPFFIYKFYRCANLLKRKNIDKVQSHLDELVFINKLNYIISNKGIVDLKKYTILNYEDINEIYYKYGSNNRGGSLNRYLVVVDKKNKKHFFIVGLGMLGKSNNLYDFYDLALEKNPKIKIK